MPCVNASTACRYCRVHRSRSGGRALEMSFCCQQGTEPWKCRSCGKRGKPEAGFPLFPRAPWESRQRRARFPHSHSSDDEGDGKVENPKQVFHFPTASVAFTKAPTQAAGARAAALRAPQPTTSTNSVTFPIEATRPGILIVAEQLV